MPTAIQSIMALTAIRRRPRPRDSIALRVCVCALYRRSVSRAQIVFAIAVAAGLACCVGNYRQEILDKSQDRYVRDPSAGERLDNRAFRQCGGGSRRVG